MFDNKEIYVLYSIRIIYIRIHMQPQARIMKSIINKRFQLIPYGFRLAIVGFYQLYP